MTQSEQVLVGSYWMDNDPRSHGADRRCVRVLAVETERVQVERCGNNVSTRTRPSWVRRASFRTKPIQRGYRPATAADLQDLGL